MAGREYTDETFTGQTVVLDGCKFTRCRFISCDIEFTGPTLPSWGKGCKFGRPGGELDAECRWHFLGSMSSIINFIFDLYFLMDEPDRQSIAIAFNDVGIKRISKSNSRQVYITFKECMINTQKYKSQNPDDDHVFSAVLFDMAVDGAIYKNLFTDVRQGYQSDYDRDPIELTTPFRGHYSGPFPRDTFNDAVEDYYRSVIGRNAEVLRFDGAESVLLQNVRIHMPVGPIVLGIPEQNAPSGGWLLDDITGWMRRKEQPSSVGTTPLGEIKHPQEQAQPSAESLDRND